jgi:transcriptional regulator with XRE-family HTH domain
VDRLKNLIGTNVKFYRVKNAVSQTDLAAVAGVSRRVLQSVEAGEHNITFDVLAAIAAALKIEVKSLITEKRIVFHRGLASFDKHDYVDGGSWAYGVRDMDGTLIGASQSALKVTGIDLIKNKNQTNLVTLIDENTMMIHAPGGDKIMAIIRIGILGPDYIQVGWLSYGYEKCALYCADQITEHILNVILKLKEAQ